jgi:hypothetical protein
VAENVMGRAFPFGTLSKRFFGAYLARRHRVFAAWPEFGSRGGSMPTTYLEKSGYLLNHRPKASISQRM